MTIISVLLILSCLLLAKDGANDGYLRLNELFGLDLGEANLVALSACETGLSKVQGGDDLVGLSRGLISGFTHTSRNNRGSVMLSYFSVGRIEVGFIAAGAGDLRPEIIRDQDLGNAAKEFKGVDMALDPGGKVLGEGGFGKGVITGP